MVQIGPDFFIFAIVLFGYYFWCYKEVVGPAPEEARPSWRTRWLLSPRSDVVAAVLLGISVFAKPTKIALILPLLVSAALRRQWTRGFKIGAMFGVVVAALFALNIAVTGEWNYQGGERKTFYSTDGVGFKADSRTRTKPTPSTPSASAGSAAVRSTCLFTRDALLEVFPHNLGYFLFGRHTDLRSISSRADGDPAVSGRDARSRDVAVADAGGGRRYGGRVAALHAVHLVGWRRPRGQSLFPWHLRRVPVSRAASANGGGGHPGDGDQRAVCGADRLEPVLRGSQSRRAQQDRSVSAGCRPN